MHLDALTPPLGRSRLDRGPANYYSPDIARSFVCFLLSHSNNAILAFYT